MSGKRKRIDLSLTQKVDVLEQVDKKVPQNKIAERFGVSQSQISRIANNKTHILSQWEQSENPTRKRRRPGKNADVELALKTWFMEVRNDDIPLTGPVLKEKAKNLAETLNKPDFVPSSGWISRWKDKLSLTSKRPKRVVDTQAAEKWENEDIPKLLEKYGSGDIYTAKEMGIFFQATPEGIHTIKNEQRTVDKENERITILAACNISGTDKRQLLVIGKRKIPRCVSGVPVKYICNKQAWITRDIFRQWCLDLDTEMKEENRKIVLVVNHCSVHPVETATELDNVKLIFFPANSKQPCEQGIISSFRCLYKKQVVYRILAELNIEDKIPTHSCVKEISLMDALHMLQKSWIEVPKETITICFQKAGFRFDKEKEVMSSQTDVTAPEGISQQVFDSFIKIDEHIECFGAIDDDSVKDKSSGQCDGDDSESGEPTRVVASEALRSLVTVRRYLECHEVVDFEAFYALETKLHSTIRNAVKRKTMNNYV